MKKKPELKRKDDWEERLADFLGKHHATAQLEFGEFDCAIGLASGAIKAMTGKDLGKEFRGKYKTALEGHKLVREKGHKGLVQLVSSLLEEKPVAFAQRGDVVIYQGCLGVCNGRVSFFMPASDKGEEPGLMRVETLNCEKAWKV